MMFRSILVALSLTTSGAAWCHDFWLAPEHYQLKKGESVPVGFLIGDVGESEPWKLRWERVASLQMLNPDGSIGDLQAVIRTTTDGDAGGATATVDGPGTYMLAFQSYHSFNDLAADRFNPYAVDEGLTPAIAQREATKTTEANGKEIYSRRSKALLQVGKTLSAQVLKPIGQTLEIVPEQHPYAVRAGNALPLRIYYRGLPLSGATVTMHRLDADIDDIQRQLSDADGRVRFAVPSVGSWKANVVWTQPLKDHERADFDTVFTSLSFGFAASTAIKDASN